MTRRATENSSESLELLLDTICNTFGAVIFISILVAVLVSQSGETSSQDDGQPDAAAEAAAEAAIVQTEIQAAQERVRVLAGQLRQQKLVTRRFASEESLALAGLIRQRTEERVRLMAQKSEAVKEISAVKAESVSLQQQFEQQEAMLKAAMAENKRLKQQLNKQQQLSGRTARIPRLRKTDKVPVVYALDDSRLHRVTTAAQTVDNADCERNTKLGVEVITPRAGAGVAVENSQPAEIESRFAGLSKDNHFVQVFVSRDSFAAFHPVRDALVHQGLEYEVIITENDQVELFMGESQRESFVQ
ncbi:MAG: hypothetical protein RIK87_24895 [Fuerstiella sp.]